MHIYDFLLCVREYNVHFSHIFIFLVLVYHNMSPIKLIMFDKNAEVDLIEGVLAQSTVKSVFLLQSNSVIALNYDVNGKTKYCK